MKKVKEMYGVKIVKPWSQEMYDHNELVAEEIRSEITKRWELAMKEAAKDFEDDLEEDQIGLDFYDCDWDDWLCDELIDIQKVVTCYSFGMGYNVGRVEELVTAELENAAFFRLKEMAEDLELDLKEELIGL